MIIHDLIQTLAVGGILLIVVQVNMRDVIRMKKQVETSSGQGP
jgi:hypothetical protein